MVADPSNAGHDPGGGEVPVCPCTGCRGATRVDLFRSPLGKIYQNQGNDYYTGEQYTSALNHYVGEGNWSVRVLEHGYDQIGDEFWALVELEATLWYHDADGVAVPQKVVKQQFGGQSVKRARSTGDALSTSDDRKGAVTDGLKKCASLLGFGLDLWVKDAQNDLPYRRPEDQPAGGQPRANTRQDAPGGAPAARNAPGGSRPQVAPADAASLDRYRQLIQDAIEQGFQESWANQSLDQLTSANVGRYIARLEGFLGRVGAGAA